MQRGTDVIADLPYTPLSEKAEEAIQQLYNLKIQSVIIEGGRKTLERFLEIGLWDEVRILVGNQCWGKGLKAPKIPEIPKKIVNIDDNQLIYVRRHL